LGTEDAVDQIRDFAGGEGADAVFECVGTADTMKFAARAARGGGQIVVIGEEPEFPAIDTIQIAQRELEIIGSRNGSIQDAANALELISAGIIQPPIAARFPLSELNEALQTLRSGQASGRLIIQVR
jgi:D-arabinose 1-dehydrogenase-like Zn-dependent alcohol dehydrogenase